MGAPKLLALVTASFVVANIIAFVGLGLAINTAAASVCSALLVLQVKTRRRSSSDLDRLKADIAAFLDAASLERRRRVGRTS